MYYKIVYFNYTFYIHFYLVEIIKMLLFVALLKFICERHAKC